MREHDLLSWGPLVVAAIVITILLGTFYAQRNDLSGVRWCSRQAAKLDGRGEVIGNRCLVVLPNGNVVKI